MAELDSFNPYAAPKTAHCAAPVTESITYDGECLIVPKGYVFPRICLKSGDTSGLSFPRRQKITWHPPLGLSKRGEVEFFLSKKVARKWAATILRFWGAFALSFVFTFLAFKLGNRTFAGAGAIGFLASIVLAAQVRRLLWAKRIDKTHIWLCGIPAPVAYKIASGDLVQRTFSGPDVS